MGTAGRRSALTTALALVAALVAFLPATATAHDGHGDHATDHADPQNSIAAAAQAAVAADGAAPAEGPTLPPGFADVEAIGDLSEAIAVSFAPDGTAFIALKTGVIKSFDYNAGTGEFEPLATSTHFADLSRQVNNYWDRGLTGIAVDPQFGTSGHNYVYVNYTYNRDPRDNPPVVPKWGDPSQQYDECPEPADPDDTSIAGCVVMDRVTRLTAQRLGGSDGWTMVPNSELELLASGCFQFGSHASGDVAFGPDGFLYASAGEGASFDSLDYGQYANPCADPGNEGGSLRSQDYRTSSDVLGVDGTVFRIDPATGLNPTQATADEWLVAYGQRNPWRLEFRPGTDELWSRDVGASLWEEVNRIPDVGDVASPINRGWPCYEGSHTGSLVQPGWDALDKPLCESLYAQGTSAVTAPYFSYETRGPKLTGPDEDCFNSTSAGSGVAFGSSASNYPAAYEDAMFFSDFARSCIWVLGKKPNGDPDPTDIQRFVENAETPVDLVTGPGGDIYYVDYGLDDQGVPTEGEAGVHRVVYTGSNATPTARIVADQTSGPAPLTVNFDGTTSTDPDGDTLTYAWDLDGDGQYDDSTAATPSRTYSVGTYDVGLRVDDGHGHTSTATQQLQAGNSPPVLGTVTPAGTLTWAAGDTIDFSATATDPQQGTMPGSSFSWNLAIRHCPNDVCHTHNLQTYPGASSGSFQAPPHEYPSHLLLTVTVTDDGGLTDTQTIQLNPKTVSLSFASVPSGAMVTIDSTDRTTPYSETFIQGAPVTVTAAPTTGTGATIAAFSSWSDGGARSHTVTPPSTATTYTATYTRPTAALAADPPSGPAPLSVTYTASATNAPGASGPFTFAWDLDDDGQYDDGTGTTQSRTYSSPGSPVVSVLATDSRGATDAKSVTVTVGPANRNPVAAISADPTSGPAPLAVSFSAAGSTDPDGDPLGYAWDLDNDGAFDDATGLTASRTYSGVGQKTASVLVTDGRGGSDSKSVNFTVTNRLPVAAAAATPSSGPAPLAVSLSAEGSSDPDGTALSYAWDTDDDGQFDDATGLTTSATFTGVGPHVVTVRVTDADGGSATDAVTVTVTNRNPTAEVAATPSSGPAPLAVSLSAEGSSDPDGTALSYAWDTDDDGQFDDATGLTTSATFTGVGPHVVTVQVTDADGGSATDAITVTVTNRDPTAAVAANPTSGNAPLVVSLSASGSSDPDGTALTYAWDTDDDGQFDDATGVSTSATFTGVGPHVVTVRVTDADGGSATDAVTVTVTNRDPTAAVAANPTSGNAPLVVSLSASGSSDPDGTALTYAWDTDDDGEFDDATGVSTSATFTGVGPHVVTVRVTDADGGSATDAVTVTVTNSGPTARITSTPSPATGNAPLLVDFDGSTSSDPDGGTLTYEWDLDGDGQYDDATGDSASRTYGVGNVTVGLMVTDVDGASSTAFVPVTVPNRLPDVVLSADPTTGPAPLAVAFSADGSSDPDGTVLTYAWDLDDDGAFDDATGVTASRTYSEVGPHQVTVQVTDADNGATTESVTVTVTNSGPTAVITTSPDPATGPAPLTVAFDASTSSDPDGGTLTYGWDLDGDGQYDDGTGATAASTYPVGTVTVGLRVTDQQGSSATTTATVTATNTAPTVTRVSTYPAGTWYVGQTLGFDAAATDPQQDLPESAYSFVMERQDCDSGCPRVVVQRWAGVSTERFVVPAMPYPSHLYLTATVTDDHGATDSRTVRIEPRQGSLTVETRRDKLKVKVDGVKRKGGWTQTVVVGSTVRLVAPRTQVKKGLRYVFVRWTDGGARKHERVVGETPVTLRAVYRRAR